MQGNASSLSANPKVNNANVPSGSSPSKLIIDSGATNHIISSPTLLFNIKENTSLPPIVMPNGNQAPIKSIVSLTNVLGVPSCTIHLMSVSRVTRDLNCSVTFFPCRCILLDLMTRMTIGLGKQQGGLYYMVVMTLDKSHNPIPSLAAHVTKSSPPSNTSTTLWHRRLEHPSPSRLDFMAKTLLNLSLESNTICDICTIAKQTCHLCEIFLHNKEQLTNILALTHHNKTELSSVNIDISLSHHTLFVFKPSFPYTFGQNVFPLLYILLIGCLRLFYHVRHLLSAYMVKSLFIHTFKFLDVLLMLLMFMFLISLLLVPKNVFFFVILLAKRLTSYMISKLTKSSLVVMLSSIRIFFRMNLLTLLSPP